MRRTNNISVIIPAAGMGRRMKSYGPKALIDLPGGQNVINRQIQIIKDVYPKAEIIATVGFQADKIIRHLPDDVKVVENELFHESNVARSIDMALRVANHDNVLIIYGDLVFNHEAIDGAVRRTSACVTDRSQQMAQEEVGTVISRGKIANFEYGVETKWSQIAYLTGLELHLFKKTMKVKERKKWFGFEIFNKVIDAGGKFAAINPPGMKIAEIDFTTDIENARSIAHENLV